jgi:hypothetical protein
MGNRKRQMKHQELSDRELFKNRAAFNVKQRQDHAREQKARDAAKTGNEAEVSRSEKAERAEAQRHEQSRAEQAKEAVREFNARREDEAKQEPPSSKRAV